MFALQSRWDRSLIGLTETLRREIERLQSHLGETEIPIGETENTRFLAVAMSIELGGSGYAISVGLSLNFWIRTYVEVRKWLRALEHITKHFEQASH